MSLADYIIIAFIVFIVGLAVFKIIRDKKRGKSCCGDCSGCNSFAVCKGGKKDGQNN